MADQDNDDGGRWDVGAKDGVVYVERRSEDNQPVFSDQLEPDDARQLAGLLTKFADKAQAAGSDDSDSDDESDDDDSKDESDDDSDSDDDKDD
ncbi:hypothetical protein H7J88_05850 [Mycolicibacterium flavescens]|uniref:Uncharacterized protein n=1 Tax=Mycolicibacterium flavescens TaxID=1776 RepID=A0A1E3RAJ5_MYCFV|nr:hypothetical protein [Mycolicibacterium flavescens]MCV7279168.1 hypothetical protein [Mycolicibacterium flavescens]ODQ86935.1 hypothetical protein BHQ18_25805 [Mycolicibacterium flavescens]